MDDLFPIPEQEEAPEGASPTPTTSNLPDPEDERQKDDDRFDWSDDDCVILQQQRAVAVYRNRMGGIVVREEGDYPDEDAFIVLRDEDAVRALMAALQREIGGGK